MRIYLTPPAHESRGLQRIADALTRYAPVGSEIVDDEREADLVVLYAIGRCEALTRQAAAIMERGREYAVVQCCLRSTQKPHTKHWIRLWQQAEVVWSYYDLEQATADDEGVSSVNVGFHFYYAPLGVDSSVFYPETQTKVYTILSSGLSRLSESVRECAIAASSVGGSVCHLGAQLDFADGLHVTCFDNITDDWLRLLYSSSQFVSGLRRTEGFELPAAEGLLCGARPIVFDTPDYHWAYKDHAEYVPEGSRAEVVESLVELFRRGPRPVTPEERQRAAEWFNWERVVRGFYDRCS